jgi:anti-sigma28 factor (negative regulator of flagellin synthesis)
MDINGIGQKNIDDIKADSLWLTSTKPEKKEGSLIEDLIPGADSASVSELDKLKNQAAEAQEPGRAAYLEKLKAAVAEGKFDVATEDLADSLIDDGFINFLID